MTEPNPPAGPASGTATGTAKPRTVPTELAALAMGVTPATIRKWASRGKLTRHGGPRRAEYDLDELFALARRSETE
ncbi:MerR family transcriptional regulator [Streptomyces sp. NPDC001833]|uniref:MerR family transcriptional regulator n=1 Tax=Streptomyces sp. NPDC001833 TaxID=3154658 RepID=UPI00332C514F